MNVRAIDRPVAAAWTEAILRCPECRGELVREAGHHCAACGFRGPPRDLRALDSGHAPSLLLRLLDRFGIGFSS